MNSKRYQTNTNVIGWISKISSTDRGNGIHINRYQTDKEVWGWTSNRDRRNWTNIGRYQTKTEIMGWIEVDIKKRTEVMW